MSGSAIYRRVKMFRTMTGFHPDEYEMPGVSVDFEVHQSAPPEARKPAQTHSPGQSPR